MTLFFQDFNFVNSNLNCSKQYAADIIFLVLGWTQSEFHFTFSKKRVEETQNNQLKNKWISEQRKDNLRSILGTVFMG